MARGPYQRDPHETVARRHVHRIFSKDVQRRNPIIRHEDARGVARFEAVTLALTLPAARAS
jgi:hypothetical protein